MKTLIINADDMGVSPAVNDAIIRLYQTESITGTSIIAVGTAFSEACRALRDNEIREVGVHLTLTGKFRPVTSETKGMKNFLTKEGYFPPDYVSLAAKLYLGKIKKQTLRDELYSQIEKIREEGFTITHLDSHEHIHVLPGILDTVLELCAEFEIPYIRLPRENPFVCRKSFNCKDLIRYAALRLFSSSAARKISKTSLSFNTSFLGHFHSGRLNNEILSFMAENITDGTTELAVHPAVHSLEFLKNSPWYKNAQTEMNELTKEAWKTTLKTKNITPTPHSKATKK